MKTGPRNLITDVEGLLVGNAEDDLLRSGVTVLTADRPFTAAVHVMGGAPGTRETDLLAPDRLIGAVDALVDAYTMPTSGCSLAYWRTSSPASPQLMDESMRRTVAGSGAVRSTEVKPAS